MTPAGRRAVFFDRDGVLNHSIVVDGKPYPPATPRQCSIVAGARQCLEELQQRGFCLIVITNQPDVARGTMPMAVVEEINQCLRRAVPLDDVLVCYHDDADHCTCRKPSPGLLLQAKRKHGLDLSRSFLVGDRWRDIDAGEAAGCRTAMIDYQYRERAPQVEPTVRVGSLREAVDWIKNQE